MIDLTHTDNSLPMKYKEKLFMSWEDVNIIAKSSLVTIGAHTISHPLLVNLNDETAYSEILLSKKIIENKINKTINHFAFPFGGDNEISLRDTNIVRESGFMSAVTTRFGGIYNSNYKNYYELPRVFFKPGRTLNDFQIDLKIFELKKLIKKFYI